MRYPDYKPQIVEPELLKYWQTQKVLEKLRDKNKNNSRFTFLQGPPYTSGKIHLGHAWNYALKDLILRYKRFQGYSVWDRNGYDMHGLPTERKVMELHQLKFKEDIQKFGLERFAQECLKWSTEKAKDMDKDFQRLGVTLDFSDPYLPVTNEYMEGCWWLIKRAEEQKRLYLGERTTTWCANCETALAKHECEYQNVKENSIFIKLPLKNKKNEYLVVWTTTPWTIAFNLAVMVNPELDYVQAEAIDPKTKKKEVWYLARALAGVVIQAVAGKKINVLKDFKGAEMKGWEYLHPWLDEITELKKLKSKHPNVHTVILSEEYVDTSAGSGLVHCAPGCGPEDYEVGHANNIPPFNSLNEKGIFPDSMGLFAGKIAKTDDKFFIEKLKQDGNLIETTPVEHDYAHCQRCHKPVVFRVTPQWFFKVEDLKEKMQDFNTKIDWIPETAKNAFTSWLNNLRDNSITKQRFWGTPLPVWRCEKCQHYDVFGSIAELKAKAKNVPKSIHKPWIDEVKYPCQKCKGTMKRIPDVLDVWIDAGCAGWNCYYYPQKKELLKLWYPASFILEGKDQIRGWFNMLMIASVLALGQPSFEKVYMHGFITDVTGVKMSKSLGNIISPYEVIDKHGADVLRYYMCQTNAGEDINFSWDEATLKARNLQILWNVHKFLINLANENDVNPFQLKEKDWKPHLGIEERYILSKLHSTIMNVTELLEAYRLDEIIAPLEELYLELSRTYIQLVRDKSALGTPEEKKAVLYVMSQTVMEFLKMFSLVAPFISEAIYLNLKEEFGLKEISISHYSWPKYEMNQINGDLESRMESVQQLLQSILFAREKAKLGVRWPVKEVVIVSKNKEVEQAVTQFNALIAQQTNAKMIKVQELMKDVKSTVKPNYNKIAPVYKQDSAEIIAKLAMESPESILGHINKDNHYRFKVNHKDVEIVRDMLLIERTIPDGYIEAEFKQGQIYLNTERTPELEAEGLAREIMRNVQQLRKKAGLEKTDEINLFLQVAKDKKPLLEKLTTEIKAKVGAKTIKIDVISPAKKYQHTEQFKIKNELVGAWLEKV